MPAPDELEVPPLVDPPPELLLEPELVLPPELPVLLVLLPPELLVLPVPPPPELLLPELPLVDEPLPAPLLLPELPLVDDPLPLPPLLLELPDGPESPPVSPALWHVWKPNDTLSVPPSGPRAGPPPPPPPVQSPPSPQGSPRSEGEQYGPSMNSHTPHVRLTPVAPPLLLEELLEPAPELLPEPASNGGTAHPLGSAQQVASMQVPPLQGFPRSAMGHSWRSANALPPKVRPTTRREEARHARFMAKPSSTPRARRRTSLPAGASSGGSKTAPTPVSGAAWPGTRPARRVARSGAGARRREA